MAGAESRKRTLEAIFGAIWLIVLWGSPVLGQPSHARIAVLTPGGTFAPVLEGLKERLGRLGYKEGQSITFIVEDTKGIAVNLAPHAGKLLAAKPDILVPVTTIHTAAAKQATATLPIVFAWTTDPDKAGLIASYASSKNNLTGVASLSGSLTGKRLEILLELAPRVKRALILMSSLPSAGQVDLPLLEATAMRLGVQLVRRAVGNRGEIEKTLRDLPQRSFDAIFSLPAAMVRANMDLLIKKAKSERIPFAVQDEVLVEGGALFSYGPHMRQVGMQAAALVNKVLKGAKPSEIVVETPDRLFLTINLVTAKEIGLNIPRGLLGRADRLIE